MVIDAPSFKNIADDLLNFIDNDILIGHNVNFDINFLYDYFLSIDLKLSNDFVDTLRLSRILVKDSKNHKLKTLATYFNITRPNHRSEADVNATKDLYDKLREINNEVPSLLDDFINRRKNQRRNYKNSSRTDFSKITADKSIDFIDTDSPFFKKSICFTGKMDVLTKAEAAQLVANLGGIIQNNVNTKSDFLVLGDLEYQKERFGDKSSKHKKAEKLIDGGQELEIMTEITFLELIDE